MVIAKKDNSITIAKGIGIVLMVLAHSGFYTFGIRFIGMFHMPLFFILAGYCFKEKYLDNMGQFVWRRVKGLWWPYAKYGLLFVLLHNAFFYFNIYNEQYGWDTDVPHPYTLHDTFVNGLFSVLFFHCEPLLGGYWFLPELFLGSVMGIIAIKFLRNPFVGCGIALLLSVWGVSCDLNVPYSCINKMSFHATTFFLIGYIIKKYQIQSKGWYGLACLSVVVVGALFWPSSMPNCSLQLILPYTFCAVCGTLMTMQVSQGLERKELVNKKSLLITLRSFFLLCGENTLTILTWHFLSFKLVSWLAIGVEGKPIEMLSSFPVMKELEYPFWWILYTVVGLGIPLTLVFVRKKVLSIRT